jgi:hypothetical protein
VAFPRGKCPPPPPGTHRIGGWVGIRDGLDAVEQRKILHCRDSNPGLWSSSLVLYFSVLLHSYSQYMHAQPPSQVQCLIFMNFICTLDLILTVLHVSAWRHQVLWVFLAIIVALYYFLSFLYALSVFSLGRFLKLPVDSSLLGSNVPLFTLNHIPYC